MRVAGEDVTRRQRARALRAGVGHVPEDRQRRGLVLDFTLAENIGLHDYRKRAVLHGSGGCSRSVSSSAHAG